MSKYIEVCADSAQRRNNEPVRLGDSFGVSPSVAGGATEKMGSGARAFDAKAKSLHEILKYKRNAGSASELACIARFILPLNPDVLCDPDGVVLAYVVVVGTASRTAFCCHTDTVHRTSGMQEVIYDSGTGLFYMPDNADSECLGADDGAGIWLLLEMIDAGVPGTYIFHRSEEKGGVGSAGLAAYHEVFLTRHDRAIAFDRRGNSSVITHQGWGRCCSDKFAQALADALNEPYGLSLAPDNTGIFTDTANYIEYIPECTNISCGYESEHSANEMLDVEYLQMLREAVLKIDWEALPTVRKAEPEVYEPSFLGGWGKRELIDLDDLMGMSYGKLLKWVRENKGDPDLIADMLFDAFDRIAYTEEHRPWEQPDEMDIWEH